MPFGKGERKNAEQNDNRYTLVLFRLFGSADTKIRMSHLQPLKEGKDIDFRV